MINKESMEELKSNCLVEVLQKYALSVVLTEHYVVYFYH